MDAKLRTEAAARYLGLARSTLAKMRVRGDGPPYAKAGSRVVVYDIADLNAWLRGTRRTSTRSVQSIGKV
jgi:predicted DNA-binding transcriptional regulator AlpA